MKAPVTAMVAMLCVACSGGDPAAFRRSWKRVELPGFSIVIPPGEVVHTSTETWTGKHQVKLEGSLLDRWVHDVAFNGNVSVSWSSETYSRDEWRTQFVPAISAAMKQSIPDAGLMQEARIDESRWYAVIGNAHAPVALGVARCDAFQVNIAYAHYHDASKQVADLLEMMSSIRCAEGVPTRVRPVAPTSLPPKFVSVEGEDGLQMYQSPDGEGMAVNFTQGDVQRDDKVFLAIMRPLLAQALGVEESSLALAKIEDSRAGLSSEPTILRAVQAGGETSYVGALYCGSVKQSVLSIWSGPNASDALAIQRIGQIHCPGTGR